MGAETRELVGHQMVLLDSDRVSKALVVMERGRHGGRLGCDDFVWHFADMAHYLEYQLAQIVGLCALKRRLTAFCRGAILDQKRQMISLREGRKFKPAKARHMIFRNKVDKSGFELAADIEDAAIEDAFDELVPSDVRSRSNGRLCETAFKFAKERLDMACVNEGSISSVITMDQVREGIQKASGWGSGLQGSIP